MSEDGRRRSGIVRLSLDSELRSGLKDGTISDWEHISEDKDVQPRLE
jgi:hypothetical protein